MDDRLEFILKENPNVIAGLPRWMTRNRPRKPAGGRVVTRPPMLHAAAVDGDDSPEMSLRNAIENDELTLYYQPQFELH